MDDDLRRPDNAHALDRLREWLDWLGPARLVTSAIAVVVVCAGGWWLVRSPTPSPESGLPVATAPTSTTPTSTPPRTNTIEHEAIESGESTVVADGVVPSVSSGPVDARSSVVVHVTGAVVRPGVYVFAGGGRLADAIERAGGAIETGRPHELNLAAPLIDGMRVDVPVEGEEVSAEWGAVSADWEAGSSPVGSGASDGVARPLDVNRATTAELDELPGVGPATASAIVTDRERNGPFVSVDDLERVPGIGPAKLAGLRDLVTT